MLPNQRFMPAKCRVGIRLPQMHFCILLGIVGHSDFPDGSPNYRHYVFIRLVTKEQFSPNKRSVFSQVYEIFGPMKLITIIIANAFAALAVASSFAELLNMSSHAKATDGVSESNKIMGPHVRILPV